MPNQFRSKFGSWIPLPRPMPVPSGLITDEPKMSVCFSASWRPAVISALSVLARPETYDTDDNQLAFDTAREGSQLAVSLQDGCKSSCPTWSLMESATICTPYDSTLNFVVFSDTCQCNTDVWDTRFGSVRFSTPNGIARIAFEGHRNDDNSLCGGHICYIHAYFSQVVVGNVWTFQYKNCLGETAIETSGGLVFHKSDFDVQWFCLTSTCPFSLMVQWDGDPLCGVA